MPEHDPLLERLLAAGSMAQLEGAVAADLEAVLTAFPDWTTVPFDDPNLPWQSSRRV